VEQTAEVADRQVAKEETAKEGREVANLVWSRAVEEEDQEA
jgi:hypothetical protein